MNRQEVTYLGLYRYRYSVGPGWAAYHYGDHYNTVHVIHRHDPLGAWRLDPLAAGNSLYAVAPERPVQLPSDDLRRDQLSRCVYSSITYTSGFWLPGSYFFDVQSEEQQQQAIASNPTP